MGGWRKQKQNKAKLCSKRDSDENVAGNRRAMRRSNSWGEATWKSSSDLPRECLSRGAQSHQPVTLKIVKSMDRTKDFVKKSKRGACEQTAATVLPNRTAAT